MILFYSVTKRDRNMAADINNQSLIEIVLINYTL